MTSQIAAQASHFNFRGFWTYWLEHRINTLGLGTFFRSTEVNSQQNEVKVKVKVNFILEQAMKAQSGSGGIILLFL